MSIDYTLFLTRPSPPDARSPASLRCPARPAGAPVATGQQEGFGIRPTWSVYFPRDRSGMYASAPAMAAIVGEVLRQADDDALLLMNGELPILRRAGGRVLVNARTWWAGPEGRARFGIPVEVGDLGGVV